MDEDISSSPLPQCKLRITHIRQLPILRAHHALYSSILLITHRPSHKQRGHEMVIRGMRIPISRVFHQSRHGRAQLRPPTRLGQHILHGLSKLQRPVLRRRLHGKVVAKPKHGRPSVAVEIVDGTPGSDEKVVLATERTHRGSDFEMEVRVEARIAGYDGCGRAGCGEHADEDEVDVVDPVKGWVAGDREAFARKQGDASVGG